MNIFTAAVTGLTIVIKKIGIGFKAVMTGLKIAIISVFDFITSVIAAIVNAIMAAIKWSATQIVNFIHFLFRTYLRFEAGCVLPAQKFAGLLIRLRWGFVIISLLYMIYSYFGTIYLLLSVVICGCLVWIGYQEAEKEEENWNIHIEKIDNIISNYLKYLIRFIMLAFPAWLFHIKFNANVIILYVSLFAILVVIIFQVKGDRRYTVKPSVLTGFIKEKRRSHEHDIRSTDVNEKNTVSPYVLFPCILFFIYFLICTVLYYRNL